GAPSPPPAAGSPVVARPLPADRHNARRTLTALAVLDTGRPGSWPGWSAARPAAGQIRAEQASGHPAADRRQAFGRDRPWMRDACRQAWGPMTASSGLLPRVIGS